MITSVFLLLVAGVGQIQSTDDDVAKLTLPAMYQVVLERAGRAQMPAILPASRVISRIDSMPVLEISEAIPLIAKALENSDPDARRFADWAYAFIAERQDGAVLLAPVFQQILDHLSDTDPAIAKLNAIVLGSFRTPLPISVVPSLQKFLESRGTYDQTGVLIIRILLKADPQNRDTQRVILNYLKASDGETEGRIIELLGLYQVKELDYQNAVLERMSSNYPSFVRQCAIKASERLGVNAVARARPIIQAIAADPAETSEVKEAARSVLLEQDRSKNVVQ